MASLDEWETNTWEQTKLLSKLFYKLLATNNNLTGITNYFYCSVKICS